MLAERMTFLQRYYEREQRAAAKQKQELKEGKFVAKPSKSQVPSLDRNCLSAKGRAMLKSLRNVTEPSNFLNGYERGSSKPPTPREPPGKPKSSRGNIYVTCATCSKRVQQPEYTLTDRRRRTREFCSSKCYFKFEHLQFCFTCHKKNFDTVHTVHGKGQIPDKLFCSNSCFNRYAASAKTKATEVLTGPSRSQLRADPKAFEKATTARQIESNVPLPQPPMQLTHKALERVAGASTSSRRGSHAGSERASTPLSTVIADTNASRAGTPLVGDDVTSQMGDGEIGEDGISEGRLSRALLAHRHSSGARSRSQASTRAGTPASRASARPAANGRNSVARSPRAGSRLKPAAPYAGGANGGRWTPSDPLKVDRSNFRHRDPITKFAEIQLKQRNLAFNLQKREAAEARMRRGPIV